MNCKQIATEYKQKALIHAEHIGVYEYTVNGKYMEYWSFYEDGFHFMRVDLDTNDGSEVGYIPWYKGDGYPIPAFLLSDAGATLYNYCTG